MTDYIFEAINSSIQAYISALTGRQSASISHNPPAQRALRRVHWSKEASSFGCAFKYWSRPVKLHWKHWIIGTMMEAIIRRWCCHVGGNSFTSLWKIVITIRQRYRHHWLTILSSTAQMSISITKITVYIMRQDGI